MVFEYPLSQASWFVRCKGLKVVHMFGLKGTERIDEPKVFT